MKKYVLKESRFSSFGRRWTPWQTVSKHDTLEVVTDVVPPTSGLFRLAVFHGGAIVATNDGEGWKPGRVNDDDR